MEKPHISNTQLEMYLRCGEQYRRRYIEAEIIPPGIALIQGKAIHRAAELNFAQKVDSHEDLPAAEIIELAAESFEAEQAGGYALNADEEARGKKIVLGQAKDQTVALAGLHAADQAPDYQPIAVEHRTRIVFPQASHDLLAITDLRDDQGRVTDFKTAGRKKPPSEIGQSTQLTIYAAAYCIDLGELPSQVRFDCLIKTKTPYRQLLESIRDFGDVRALVCRINAMLAGLKAGIFQPAPVGSWQCSPKWCGFWANCPYVNQERLQAVEGTEG